MQLDVYRVTRDLVVRVGALKIADRRRHEQATRAAASVLLQLSERLPLESQAARRKYFSLLRRRAACARLRRQSMLPQRSEWQVLRVADLGRVRAEARRKKEMRSKRHQGDNTRERIPADASLGTSILAPKVLVILDGIRDAHRRPVVPSTPSTERPRHT